MSIREIRANGVGGRSIDRLIVTWTPTNWCASIHRMDDKVWKTSINLVMAFCRHHHWRCCCGRRRRRFFWYLFELQITLWGKSVRSLKLMWRQCRSLHRCEEFAQFTAANDCCSCVFFFGCFFHSFYDIKWYDDCHKTLITRQRPISEPPVKSGDHMPWW